jgi:hypothetical protein
MSRANPIGLRLASKKRNPSFIGVSQYYNYNQLKYNIVIHKSIQQLSKQFAVPAYQIVNRLYSEKQNTKNLVLYPSILPINLRLKARQLFDSQYVLNRRRFYSVAIYITRLLKQRFEKNYNDFTENSHSSLFFDDTNYESSVLNFPVASSSKYQKWKSKKLQFCSLCPSVTFARALFRVSQNPSLSLYDNQINVNIQNQKVYKREKKAKLFEQTKQGKALDFLFPTMDSNPYLILSYAVSSFGNENKAKARKAWQKLKEFYFFAKKTSVSINSLDFNSLTLPPTNNNINIKIKLGGRVRVKNKSKPSISLLVLNCKEPRVFSLSPVFTLKKSKGRHSNSDDSRIISRTNNRTFRRNPDLDKNKHLNAKDQWVTNLKKHENANNVTSAKTTFYSFFFQYLIHIKQNNSTNTSSSCPEWPLSISFLATRVPKVQLKSLRNKESSNVTSWKKHLSFIVEKTRINSTLTVKEQENNLYFKAKKQQCLQDGVALFKNQSQHWSLKKLYSKPVINYQTIKRFILLNYLVAALPINNTLYQKSTFKRHSGATVAISFPMAKEVENKQKRLHINSVSMNKKEVPKTLSAHRISYTFCPSSSVTILNLKNIKKLTKQIEHFRSDIKLLAPLELLLHRSFSEPIGIHCISAVDNRLRKTYCNQFLKNLLFTRTSNNFLKSSYMDSQIGLLREKNAILFDFAYTKDSLVKLGLKKTNTLMQQLLETGHTKLWLRKLSSIRL